VGIVFCNGQLRSVFKCGSKWPGHHLLWYLELDPKISRGIIACGVENKLFLLCQELCAADLEGRISSNLEGIILVFYGDGLHWRHWQYEIVFDRLLEEFIVIINPGYFYRNLVIAW